MRPIYDIKTAKKLAEEPSTLYSNIMFFRDGIVVINFEYLIDNVNDNYDYLNRLIDKDKLGDDLFYNQFHWGTFRIEGNIIKTQFLNRPATKFVSWYLVEKWFEIKEDNSLVAIYKKSLTRNEVGTLTDSEKFPYIFIETNLELPSETWLKKESWFWCTKDQYEAWRKSRNLKR
jgi:hypothetical protein